MNVTVSSMEVKDQCPSWLLNWVRGILSVLTRQLALRKKGMPTLLLAHIRWDVTAQFCLCGATFQYSEYTRPTEGLSPP